MATACRSISARRILQITDKETLNLLYITPRLLGRRLSKTGDGQRHSPAEKLNAIFELINTLCAYYFFMRSIKSRINTINAGIAMNPVKKSTSSYRLAVMTL